MNLSGLAPSATGKLYSVYAEGDDDEYIDESDVSDELYRSVDAFSSDENEEFIEFQNNNQTYQEILQDASPTL